MKQTLLLAISLPTAFLNAQIAFVGESRSVSETFYDPFFGPTTMESSSSGTGGAWTSSVGGVGQSSDFSGLEGYANLDATVTPQNGYTGDSLFSWTFTVSSPVSLDISATMTMDGFTLGSAGFSVRENGLSIWGASSYSLEQDILAISLDPALEGISVTGAFDNSFYYVPGEVGVKTGSLALSPGSTYEIAASASSLANFSGSGSATVEMSWQVMEVPEPTTAVLGLLVCTIAGFRRHR